MTALAFVLAAAVGGLVRWQSARVDRDGFPLGTLLVNVSAALMAGLAAGLSTTAALILVTALLGSLSTFSTVTAELVDLREHHGLGRAAAYGTITSVAGVGAATLGLAL